MQTISSGISSRDTGVFFSNSAVMRLLDKYREHEIPKLTMYVLENAYVDEKERSTIHIQGVCNFRYYGPGSVLASVLSQLIRHSISCKRQGSRLSIWGEDSQLHVHYEIDATAHKKGDSGIAAFIKQKQMALRFCNGLLKDVGGGAECEEYDNYIEFILKLPVKSAA